MGASIVRTFTSWLVGVVLSVPVISRIGFTEEQLSWLALVLVQGIGLVLGGIYYVALRALERRWPWVGVLLGRRGEPVYVPDPPRHVAT